jgi:hypothetical protein
MDAAPFVRLRWRLKGAWLWPTYVALTFVDAVIVHALPLSGDAQALVSAWLVGMVSSLLAIVVLTPPLATVIRRVRQDMPRLVARDYAGATIAVAVTLALFGGGLMHAHAIAADRTALDDAVQRAGAYISDHAPAEFQTDRRSLSTLMLQPRMIYRSCVPNRARTRHYCVVVDRRRPFARSVSYAGSEPNGLLAEGTG